MENIKNPTFAEFQVTLQPRDRGAAIDLFFSEQENIRQRLAPVPCHYARSFTVNLATFGATTITPIPYRHSTGTLRFARTRLLIKWPGTSGYETFTVPEILSLPFGPVWYPEIGHGTAVEGSFSPANRCPRVSLISTQPRV